MKIWLIGACGVFALCGAVFNWDFFMNHLKARFFVNLIGRTGTRIFYATLGLALLALAVLMATGVIPAGSSE